MAFFFTFEESTPPEVKKLMKYYPQIVDFEDNKLIFADGAKLVYDDGEDKSIRELMDNPDIEDQFFYGYKLGKINEGGRVRNDEFFKKIYGSSKKEVESKLVEIVWCPKLVNQKIKVTSVNGIDKIIKKLSADLDKHPEFKQYLTDIGGTFNWRKIEGTNRLSMHSFGMTIDINTKYSNYWQWDCKCKNENKPLTYTNQIPIKLVKIFEKHDFIWGGNWYHYDTMHFEYRPELLN
jgi:hypothetical protein